MDKVDVSITDLEIASVLAPLWVSMCLFVHHCVYPCALTSRSGLLSDLLLCIHKSQIRCCVIFVSIASSSMSLPFMFACCSWFKELCMCVSNI